MDAPITGSVQSQAASGALSNMIMGGRGRGQGGWGVWFGLHLEVPSNRNHSVSL